MNGSLRWDKFKEKLLEKAKKASVKAWAMGIRSGILTVVAAVRIWSTLVRPLLEYGAEIWGPEKWNEAEKVQRRMGRRILGLRENVNNEVVYGALGWWTLRTRRDLLRLRYWRKLLTMKETRLTKIVYDWENVPHSWCSHTRDLIFNLGIGEFWEQQSIQGSKAEWNKIIWDKLQNREEGIWKERMDNKPRLRTYRLFKQNLVSEDYLNAKDSRGRKQLARIRSGANRLRIDEGRAKRLPPEDRKCWFGCGEVEDERHFLMSCHVYSDLRQDVVNTVGSIEFGLNGMDIMMGNCKPEATGVVIKFVQKAMARRTRVLGLRG